MDEQKQDDQLEPIYNSSVPIQDKVWKTSQERWTIETGGERGSRRSVLAAQYDDDGELAEFGSSSCSLTVALEVYTPFEFY